MSTIWGRVSALEGKQFSTVRGKPFTVVFVDRASESLVMSSDSTAGPRIIRRNDFERAEQQGLVTTDVKPSELEHAGVARWNSS